MSKPRIYIGWESRRTNPRPERRIIAFEWLGLYVSVPLTNWRWHIAGAGSARRAARAQTPASGTVTRQMAATHDEVAQALACWREIVAVAAVERRASEEQWRRDLEAAEREGGDAA
jgi:hypothetical protein